jgi:chromosomal replication initiation ATPase DnaA
MTRANQIPLDLPVSSAEARDDLIVSPANAFAVDFLDAWPAWPGSLAILCGPPGSGKTHMARIWAARSGALTIPVAGLARFEHEPVPASNIVVDDASAGTVRETALFHLLNHVRAANRHCLITARRLPSAWGVALPDLVSRLRSAQLVELAEPDDALLSQVMVKLFADRQIAVDPGVIDYVVKRMERSLAAAGALVAEMDREALARNRRVTRAIAANALEKIAQS